MFDFLKREKESSSDIVFNVTVKELENLMTSDDFGKTIKELVKIKCQLKMFDQCCEFMLKELLDKGSSVFTYENSIKKIEEEMTQDFDEWFKKHIQHSSKK